MGMINQNLPNFQGVLSQNLEQDTHLKLKDDGRKVGKGGPLTKLWNNMKTLSAPGRASVARQNQDTLRRLSDMLRARGFDRDTVDGMLSSARNDAKIQSGAKALKTKHITALAGLTGGQAGKIQDAGNRILSALPRLAASPQAASLNKIDGVLAGLLDASKEMKGLSEQACKAIGTGIALEISQVNSLTIDDAEKLALVDSMLANLNTDSTRTTLGDIINARLINTAIKPEERTEVARNITNVILETRGKLEELRTSLGGEPPAPRAPALSADALKAKSQSFTAFASSFEGCKGLSKPQILADLKTYITGNPNTSMFMRGDTAMEKAVRESTGHTLMPYFDDLMRVGTEINEEIKNRMFEADPTRPKSAIAISDLSGFFKGASPHRVPLQEMAIDKFTAMLNANPDAKIEFQRAFRQAYGEYEATIRENAGVNANQRLHEFASALFLGANSTITNLDNEKRTAHTLLTLVMSTIAGNNPTPKMSEFRDFLIGR